MEWGKKAKTDRDVLWAEPCVKVALSSGSKEASFLPSKPTPNAIAGSEQEASPRSNVPVAAPVPAVEFAAGGAAPEQLELAPALDVSLENGAVDDDDAVLLSAGAVLLLPAAPAAPAAPAPPATAASISSAVASSTSRFWETMQPCASSATSQVLPLAVGSPIWPGAKVPL